MADDFILIEPYNPDWPALAKLEVAKLKELLHFKWLVAIEHIGSTAIPDLPAKPIIDLAVGVTDLEAAKKVLVPILEQNGYAFWAENPDLTKLFFVKGMPPFGEKRTHHIHVMSVDHHDWVVRPLYRDYLIHHPEARHAYAQLKQDLAKKFHKDREAYTQAKTEFVRNINRKAIKPYLEFERLTKDHLPLLQDWLNEHHIKKWWDQDMTKYQSRLAADSIIKCFIIKINQLPIGFIQYYPSSQYEDAIGIDYFIGNPTFISKSLGAFLLNEFIEKELSQIKIMIVDPVFDNILAIRTYEKAGFKKLREKDGVVWMMKKT